MIAEYKQRMLENAGSYLKESGYRVFVHKDERWGSMWLIVTMSGLTTAGVFVDMHHYTCSSKHHTCKQHGTGISTLDWGEGVCTPEDLAPYVAEALVYPCPLWYMAKAGSTISTIKPMNIYEIIDEYEKLNWSLEEM